jgi:hypothetical protein
VDTPATHPANRTRIFDPGDHCWGPVQPTAHAVLIPGITAGDPCSQLRTQC